jgi:hypothetical protein
MQEFHKFITCETVASSWLIYLNSLILSEELSRHPCITYVIITNLSFFLYFFSSFRFCLLPYFWFLYHTRFLPLNRKVEKACKNFALANTEATLETEL